LSGVIFGFFFLFLYLFLFPRLATHKTIRPPVVFAGAAANKAEVKSLAEANAACANTSYVFTELPLRLWPSCLPGYTPHLVASFGEWLTALFYFAYFLSFTKKCVR
jgi:hypothetical protein